MPAGLELTYLPTDTPLMGSSFGGCGCADCGGPSWTYVIDGATIGKGPTTWAPRCWDPDAEAKEYAAELLAIAAQQFIAGCPSEEPPRVRPPRQLVEGNDHPTERKRSLDAAWQRVRDSGCKGRR